MIRVVYRWQVKPEDFEAFKHIWSVTTNGIHDTIAGAKGSFLLKSLEDDTHIITIAKWDSKEAWETFWGNANPVEMQNMRTLGQRLSVEVFEEVEDHTR